MMFPDVDTRTAAGATRCVAAYSTREQTPELLKRAFPRRRARLILARTASHLNQAFRDELVDAAIVDVEHASDETWRAAGLAREFPSAPFFGLAPYRGADGPAI